MPPIGEEARKRTLRRLQNLSRFRWIEPSWCPCRSTIIAKAELRLVNVVETDHTLAGQKWQLQCNSKMITGVIDRLLGNNLHEKNAQKMVHTIRNRQWRRLWVWLGHIQRSLLSKFRREKAVVWETQDQWKATLYKDPTCLCCGKIEATDHTFICDDEKMEEAFKMNFEGLRFHLRATTSKAISDSILEICQSIHYAQDHMIVKDWDEELTDIVTKQTRKGQRALIGGLWPKKWHSVQKQYYVRTRSTRSPSVLMTKTTAHT